MTDATEGAGPALAAHSKDAATPGHRPASEAIGKARQVASGEHITEQLIDFAQRQPLTAMALCLTAGFIVAKVSRV
jgi:hypothetical protein